MPPHPPHTIHHVTHHHIIPPLTHVSPHSQATHTTTRVTLRTLTPHTTPKLHNWQAFPPLASHTTRITPRLLTLLHVSLRLQATHTTCATTTRVTPTPFTPRASPKSHNWQAFPPLTSHTPVGYSHYRCHLHWQATHTTRATPGLLTLHVSPSGYSHYYTYHSTPRALTLLHVLPPSHSPLTTPRLHNWQAFPPKYSKHQAVQWIFALYVVWWCMCVCCVVVAAVDLCTVCRVVVVVVYVVWWWWWCMLCVVVGGGSGGVCAPVRGRVCVQPCVCVHSRVCVCGHVCVDMCIQPCVCPFTCVRVWTCMCVWTYVFMHVCVWTCVSNRVRVFIHVCGRAVTALGVQSCAATTSTVPRLLQNTHHPLGTKAIDATNIYNKKE